MGWRPRYAAKTRLQLASRAGRGGAARVASLGHLDVGGAAALAGAGLAVRGGGERSAARRRGGRSRRAHLGERGRGARRASSLALARRPRGARRRPAAATLLVRRRGRTRPAARKDGRERARAAGGARVRASLFGEERVDDLLHQVGLSYQLVEGAASKRLSAIVPLLRRLRELARARLADQPLHQRLLLGRRGLLRQPLLLLDVRLQQLLLLLVVQMQHLHLQLLLSDLVGDLVGDLRHVLQLLAARRRWRGCRAAGGPARAARRRVVSL
mmetsp:Transcript_51618/g.163199  ORF Transcript_51618/g.163199 Transcript_51618/m.163199 type:complete len:271 (+) Transcript_51618:369-1181(+)